MNHPMMKCGCAAQGACSSKSGITYDPPIPACLVHDCIEVADGTPDLHGRQARCAYNCGSIRPSSLNLPFFEYLGVGSPETEKRCKCGYYWIAHQPRWKVKIKVIRRWFKHERYEDIITKEFHAPEQYKHEAAEREAEFFRSQTHDEQTRVFSVEIQSISPTSTPLKCASFTAIGPQQFDKFYCGCKGWD